MLNNTLWLFADRIMRMILGLLVGAWMARYLGPEQFGFIAYYIALLAVLGAFANYGIDYLVIRDCSKDESLSNSIISGVFLFRILLGAVVYLFYYIYILSLEGELSYYLAAIGAILLLSAFNTIDLWFQANKRNKETAILNLISFILISIVRVYAIVEQLSIEYFLLLLVFESLLSACLMFWWYIYNNQRITISFTSISKVKSYVSEGFPYMISTLSILLYMRIDQLMIGDMLGKHELGIYSVGIVFSQVWYFIPVVAVNILMPYISKYKQQGGAKYLDSIGKLIRYSIVLSVVIILSTALLSEVIIELIYGELYIDSASVLLIHVISVLPVFVGTILNIWIVNENNGKSQLVRTLSGLVVNIVLNILLIPDYGIVGAAFSTVVSQMTTMIVMFVIHKELYRIAFPK
jgi:O-antigen/teichoic acid export membrane protein